MLAAVRQSDQGQGNGKLEGGTSAQHTSHTHGKNEQRREEVYVQNMRSVNSYLNSSFPSS
jgi:hypothetical protein